ncbi:MAG: VanZ family protein, partial [Zoogloeaceae bacterium]|nr:VanZ family protein [Zoogloeaceae bacterium]
MPLPAAPPPPESSPPPLPPTGRLARYLAMVWAVLTVYGSLYPFAQWRTDSVEPFAYLNFSWPYYWTGLDICLNVLVYMPMGFCVTLALRPCFKRQYWPVFFAALLGGLLSLSMESLQSWLPSRVASNLDLACNTLGTLIGALLAAWAGLRLAPFWQSARARVIAPLPHVDLGLTLLGLWLLTQLSPEFLLFGVGDLRQALDWLPTLNYGPGIYRRAEASVVACNLLAVGLFAGAMTRGRWLAFVLAPLFFFVAALIRSLGAALLIGPENFLVWLTPGAWQGLQLGGAALAVGLLLPRLGRLLLAALALLAGSILVNLAPLNPYSAAAVDLWLQGHFLNFNGLTRWIATLWPFLALPYLFLASR